MAAVDQRPSGAWRVRWRVASEMQNLTFEPNEEALARSAAALAEASNHSRPKSEIYADVMEIHLGVDLDLTGGSEEEAATMVLIDYADRWVLERDLKPRTREEYQRLLKLHVRSTELGSLPLIDIKAQDIRSWRSGLQKASMGESTVAKTYRLLHAILETALDDEVIEGRNPCRIRKAGQYKADERPTIGIDQVFAIAEAIQPRYRLLVLLAAFAQLRFGELIGLRRKNINLTEMELYIQKATSELDGGKQVDDDPKSDAGIRVITLPKALKPDIELHFTKYAQAGTNGRLFIGPAGGIPRRRNFNRVWKKALEDAGVPSDLGLHLHDMRHTGGTWSAQTGATLKDVMTRLGHGSQRAALIYQHSNRDRDVLIATALNEMIEEARRRAKSDAA